MTTTVYDNKQRVTSTVERTAGGVVITGFEYTYDDLSRIIEEKRLADNTKLCYAYDSREDREPSLCVLVFRYSNAFSCQDIEPSPVLEYAYAAQPVAISVPLPEENYAFNLNRVYNTVTNFGNAIVRRVNIDPISGEFLVSAFVPTLGVVLVLTLGMLMAMALV